MQNRILNIDAVNKHCGENREIMLYGFYAIINNYLLQNSKQSATSIVAELRKSFTIYDCSSEYSSSPNKIPTNKADSELRKCKKSLTNLVINNYQRMKEGKPIIPLIFVIGYEAKIHTLTINHQRLATSTSYESTDYTNSELRRCYKMHAESTGELRELIEKTFNFFILKDNPGGEESFRLEQVTPFWNNPEFQAAWQQRIGNHLRPSLQKATKKQHPWREQLSNAVTLINNPSTLFKSTTVSIEKSEAVKLEVNETLVAKTQNTPYY